jgi:hypothetical protein
LGKSHGQELIPTAKLLYLVMTVVASNTTAEMFRVNPRDELGENGFARMHDSILASKN